jgi:hypothetical protein
VHGQPAVRRPGRPGFLFRGAGQPAQPLRHGGQELSAQLHTRQAALQVRGSILF